MRKLELHNVKSWHSSTASPSNLIFRRIPSDMNYKNMNTITRTTSLRSHWESKFLVYRFNCRYTFMIVSVRCAGFRFWMTTHPVSLKSAYPCCCVMPLKSLWQDICKYALLLTLGKIMKANIKLGQAVKFNPRRAGGLCFPCRAGGGRENDPLQLGSWAT